MKKKIKKERVHELKIRKRWADDILYFNKTFEVRKNDRNYQCGDIIRFLVEDDVRWPSIYSDVFDKSHSLYGKEYKITYVHSGLGLEEDYVVLGIQPLAADKGE